jgi:hypothetical protein
MRISELAKNTLKYVPILVVLVAMVTGVLIGKDLYPTILFSQPKPPVRSLMEPLIILGKDDLCGFSNIYTSLPPKCKTLDGEFIPVLEASSYIIVTPEGK